MKQREIRNDPKNTKRMKAEGEEEIQTIIEDSDDEDT